MRLRRDRRLRTRDDLEMHGVPPTGGDGAPGRDPLPDESFVVGDQLGFVVAEASANLRERQRIGVDALHHREQIPPARLGRVGARDPRVLEDASEKESALRGGVAAIANGGIRARLAERAVDGTPRVAGELRSDSSKVTPAHAGGWWLVIGG